MTCVYFSLLEISHYDCTAASTSTYLAEESFCDTKCEVDLTRLCLKQYSPPCVSTPCCWRTVTARYFISLRNWFYLRVDSNDDRRLHNVCAASLDSIIQSHPQPRNVRFNQSSIAVHYLVTFYIVLFFLSGNPKINGRWMWLTLFKRMQFWKICWLKCEKPHPFVASMTVSYSQ